MLFIKYIYDTITKETETMARPRPYKYKVKNPHKYSGDLNNVIIRSSWERKLIEFLDNNDDVIAFGSEHDRTVIPYISPIDNAYHRYYPDFIVTVKGSNGKNKTMLIEVKPYKETQPPRMGKAKTAKSRRNFRNAKKTYVVNMAKWKAARAWCKQYSVEFMIFTEYELGIKARKPKKSKPKKNVG